jgi:hypothetical protein
MKTENLFLIAACLLLASCIKKYKHTVAVCDKKFYVETFNVNPAGVDEQYLTDSFNFRFFVGKVDNEHENFNYTCKGDSIIITKVAKVDISSIWPVIETRIFSISDLKKKEKNE